jgi:ABC-type transport system involved in multi-copper enzyme maturation permease subunit
MSANSALIAVRERGWRMGLANMLAKESRAWWRTRRWWIQCVPWLLLLNGTMWLNIKGDIPVDQAGLSFLTMAGLAVPIAAISMGQDSILGERHSGTAAWVLSKPMRRPAFILAKLIALGLGLLVTGVVLPGVIAYFQLRANGLSQLLSAPGWAEAMGLVYLNVLFYLTLALMLATLVHGRGPVLAITLMIMMAGLMVWSYALVDKHAPWLLAVLPWDLLMPFASKAPLAALLATGQPLSTVMPIIGTAGWCVLFVVVAIWRFRREEF